MDRPILVDTSIWIAYFRSKDSAESAALDKLLSCGLVATCDPVKAELLSGAPTKSDFERLSVLLDSVPFLLPPEDIWRKIAEQRFLLARKGIQAALIDLWIAMAAKENNALIWTADKDFQMIDKVVSCEFFDASSVADL